MERFRNFDIHYIGLKNGITKIKFDLDSAFFGLFEKSHIQKGNLQVNLDFDKKDSFFMLKFQVDGFVHVACDRCNEDFDYDLACDFEVIVKFDEVAEPNKDEDEVIYISRNDSHINVAEIIYDYILINIPIQVFHPEDKNGNSTCNPEIIAKLTQLQSEKSEDIDPRWEQLSKLMNEKKITN